MQAARNVDIKELLYPKWNTVQLDGTTFDGRPFKEGQNLKGPVRKQWFWDMDAAKNIHKPELDIQPGARMIVAKQEQFLQAIFEYPEVFTGGARGGGKTRILLASHMVKHLSWLARGITNQTSAMFTETKEELLRRHILELTKCIPSWMGRYDAEEMIFYFHKKFGGGKLMFLYVGRKNIDTQRLLSYQMAYITIDEVTRISKEQYEFISSCLRSVEVPPNEWCVASAANPIGKSFKYIRDRFVRTKLRLRDEMMKGERRAFIQALPMDNPLLPAEYYEKQLNKLPPNLAAAFRDGNWEVFEGQFFDMLDNDIHLVTPYRAPDNVTKHVSIDIGLGGHPTTAAWWLHYPPTDDYPSGLRVVYRYYERKDKSATRHKRAIWDAMKNDKNVITRVLSHDAFANRGTSLTTVGQLFNDDDGTTPDLECIPSAKGDGIRKLRWRLMADLLSFDEVTEVDEQGNVERKTVREPQLKFMKKPDVMILYEEMAGLVHKESDPEDVQALVGSEYDVGMGDDGPDALGQGLLETQDGGTYDYLDDIKEKYDPMRDNPFLYENNREVGYGDFYM